MASFRATMVATSQEFPAGGATNWCHKVTGQPLVLFLAAGTSPLSLKRAASTIAKVASFVTLMLLTIKQLVALFLALEITVAAIPLLFSFPAPALVGPTCTAGWARPLVANLRASMPLTIKKLGARLVAREILESTATNIFNRSTKAQAFDQFRAGRARTWMAEKHAEMAAIVLQGTITDLSA